MITEERVLDFIRSFGVDRGSEALHMIEKEAVRDDVPIIRKETGELLRILLQIKKPPRIERAKANIALAGMEDKITLIAGDAAEVLKGLSGSWDFIFMDAAKGQYIHFMPEVMRLLAPGGILVSDNVLQDGDIFESRYGIKRRNHTIHNRMREYLYALTHDEAIDTVILETGDGMAISVKK